MALPFRRRNINADANSIPNRQSSRPNYCLEGGLFCCVVSFRLAIMLYRPQRAFVNNTVVGNIVSHRHFSSEHVDARYRYRLLVNLDDSVRGGLVDVLRRDRCFAFMDAFQSAVMSCRSQSLNVIEPMRALGPGMSDWSFSSAPK